MTGLALSGVGFCLALHWIMTADDLQEQRELWNFETYLLAVILIAIITAVLVAWGLSWMLPGFGFTEFFNAVGTAYVSLGNLEPSGKKKGFSTKNWIASEAAAEFKKAVGNWNTSWLDKRLPA